MLADNLRVRHLYEKMGFVLEGTKRKASFKDGDYRDVCMYAILKDDYKR